jgi:hypothetical protein
MWATKVRHGGGQSMPLIRRRAALWNTVGRGLGGTFADSRGTNQTDDSYLLFLVAPAKAGAQGLRRSVGCPWVPAFAGMTKERTGTKR